MVVNILSVCVTVLVLYLHHKDPYTQPPAWLQNLLLRKQVKVGSKTIMVKEQNLSVMESSGNKAESTSTNWKASMEKKCDCQNKTSDKWKEIASVINKMSFFLILFAAMIMAIICAIIWGRG